MLVRICLLSRSQDDVFDDKDFIQPAENNFTIVPFSNPIQSHNYDDQVFDGAKTADDIIELKGQVLTLRGFRYIMLNKPPGFISSC